MSRPTSHSSRERALKLLIVLQRAGGSVAELVLDEIAASELTATEFGILEALYHKGPMLLGDVQKKILLTSGGVTYAVDRLADKGLVERRPCATDRRARYAALTPKGAALIGKLFPRHAERIERIMSALSAAEQEQAIELLRKLGLSAAR